MGERIGREFADRYKKFLIKIGFVKNGSILKTHIDYLTKFLVEEDNPVPSIEQIASILNDAMGGAADRGAQDDDIIDMYSEFKPWFDFKRIPDKNHDWDNLTAVPKQNGVETDNEEPNKNCDCANQSKIGCNGDCIY